MVYEFQADGWDTPILVAVEFTPAGVHAVSQESFEFNGTRAQWDWFVANGWAKPA